MFRFLKTTVLCGAPFGLVLELSNFLRTGMDFGVARALITGLCFGLSMAVFMAWQRSRLASENPCGHEERLLKQGLANHKHKSVLKDAGGWLYLTDQRLVFRSHNLNFDNHEQSLPLEDIGEVQTCLTAWIIPNGVRVVTSRGEERYVVEDRRSWVEAINLARGLHA